MREEGQGQCFQHTEYLSDDSLEDFRTLRNVFASRA